MPVTATPNTPEHLKSPRARYDHRFTQLDKYRRDFVPLWKDLAQFILPNRPRFLKSDTKKRSKERHGRIRDNTATRAAGVARSGLLAGLAGPSRPWFNMEGTRPGAVEDHASRVWLEKVRDVILAIFDRSNFYTALGSFLEDEIVFGTSAMAVLSDPDDFIRCEVFPVGSYSLSQDYTGTVDGFQREFNMTVEQMQDEFGFERLSVGAKQQLMEGNSQAVFVVRHRIAVNPDVQQGAVGAESFPYTEVYWEKVGGLSRDEDTPNWGATGAPVDPLGGGVLKMGGFHELPVIVGRWDAATEDVFSPRSPGIDSLGDIKQLQEMVRVFTNGLNKMVNPPTVSGPGLHANAISQMAGHNTTDPNLASGGTGVRPLHEVNLPLRDLDDAISGVRDRINQTFMTHLFLMLLQDSRGTPPTAEEVRARIEEKSTILGPIMERHSDDVFDPVIDRVANMLMRASEPDWDNDQDGILPQPPPSLRGEPLRIQYVSEVAQAREAVNLGGLERHIQFVGGLGELNPDALDNLDTDRATKVHAAALAIDPEVSRSEEVVAQIRAERQAQRQQQEMLAAMPSLAGAAKDLAETPTNDPDSALSAVAQGLP
jgi:hypothetical protein